MHTHGRYPMIPQFQTIPGEPPNATGTRALAHVQTHGTATIPNEAIEQGIRIATIALAAPEIIATAADRITAAVHQLRAALRHRSAFDIQARATVAAQLAQTDDTNPSGGQRTEAHRTPPPSFTPPGTYAPAPRQQQPQREDAPIF
jgi:hypothetical protein